jgi:hypothetical protein
MKINTFEKAGRRIFKPLVSFCPEKFKKKKDPVKALLSFVAMRTIADAMEKARHQRNKKIPPTLSD